MAKTYVSLEFRQQLIALVQTGRTPESLAQEFELSAQTIRNWAVQASGMAVAVPTASRPMSAPR